MEVENQVGRAEGKLVPPTGWARERRWRDQAKEEIRMRVDPVVRVRDGCAGSD